MPDQTNEGVETDENGHTPIARLIVNAMAASPKLPPPEWEPLGREDRLKAFCDLAACLDFGEDAEIYEMWRARKAGQEVPTLRMVRAILLLKWLIAMHQAAEKVALINKVEDFDPTRAVSEALSYDSPKELSAFFLNSIAREAAIIYQNRWLNFGRPKDQGLPSLDKLTLSTAKQFSILSTGKQRGVQSAAKRLAEKFEEYENEYNRGLGARVVITDEMSAEQLARALYQELRDRDLARTFTALRQRIINARKRLGE